jgi:hypothetical protein
VKTFKGRRSGGCTNLFFLTADCQKKYKKEPSSLTLNFHSSSLSPHYLEGFGV